MAYTQQIKQQEAQNEDNNLVEIVLSLEAKTFLAYKHRIANRDKLLKKLERSNSYKTKKAYKKSLFICDTGRDLAKTVFHKLLSKERVLLNSKYISEITRCESTDQNKRIMDQLGNLFIIQYHRLEIVDGIPYNYHYSFKLQPAIIEELKDAGLWHLKTMPAELRLSYNNRPNTSIRSNIDLASKFLNNSISNCLDENVETTETQNPTTEVVEAKILVSKKKKFVANKRKKTTKSQRAARVYKLPPQYKEPKNLADHYPLSQEDCWELQRRSGKEYNLNGMNEILLDMSRKPKTKANSFVSKTKFMNYMTDVYREEDRSLDQVNKPTFKIIKRRPEAEIEEIVTLSQREKYLNQVESSGIHSRCDYTQLRAKISGRFPTNLGYDLLTSMITARKKDHIFKLRLSEPVVLTEHYRQLLLAQVNAIGGYSGVKELKVVIGKVGASTEEVETECNATKTAGTRQSSISAPVHLSEESQLPQGKWGKVCSLFISQQEGGEALYKHWLAPLNVVEKEGIIELSTTSDMVRDRIEQNYMPFLSKVAQSTGINKIILI